MYYSQANQNQSKQNLGVGKPTIIVIFGATGDLTERKLLPSLFSLYQKELLPDNFRIVAYSRRDLKDQDYHEFVKKALIKKKIPINEKVEEFLQHVVYQQGTFDQPENYKSLKKRLVNFDTTEFNRCSNKLFYLAVPPSFYEPILNNIAHFGLTIACSDGEGWTRILVEKPFGQDIETAKKLDQKLGKLFREEQVFRIDHYLAKETLQNILMFRFSNMLFEPIWNSKYIEKVEIKIYENIDIEGRGEFYDGIGALRDVGQNHILRMLALIAMEKPVTLNAQDLGDARTKVLKSIQKIEPETIQQYITRGQYKGYKNEQSVKPNSTTETYFKIKTFINNKRWKGVPFYLESGKAMKEAKAEIKVYLKTSDAYLCPPNQKCDYQNIISFNIQPKEGISICFWAKQPGLSSIVEPKELSFGYNEDGPTSDAYERVLFDCIRGDQSFFTTTQEVAASWKFIDSIIESWNTIPLKIYEPGSDFVDKNL